MTSRTAKIFLIATIIVLVVAFFAFDLHRFLTLESLKDRQQAFADFYSANRILTIAIYFILYVVVTALSLPGAAVMTLAGGALLGFWVALVAVSFASTIGATLAFLASRFVLRDWVQSKFGDKLKAINEGIEKEGAFYLFTLRLVPLFPFFVINLVMGLTPMRALAYYWVSQIGMLPGTAVYVNAGTQLGQLESASGILSPGIIFSFVLLGLFPLFAKRIIDIVKRRKAFSGWDMPARFDYNLIAIGAGSGGLVSAYIAAAVKAKVALIEKDKMGGDCLNTGCVPSKALIRSAKMVSYARRARDFGFKSGQVDFDFAEVMVVASNTRQQRVRAHRESACLAQVADDKAGDGFFLSRRLRHQKLPQEVIAQGLFRGDKGLKTWRISIFGLIADPAGCIVFTQVIAPVNVVMNFFFDFDFFCPGVVFQRRFRPFRQIFIGGIFRNFL
mgnify:CR=1 FL=1